MSRIIILKRRSTLKDSEQGVALAFTLMMGLLLLAGTSGLAARMLMGRKLGAAESYQQMAETAALNGFNRILGTVNKDDDENYRGYFLTLDNHEGNPDTIGDEQWLWEHANNLDKSVHLQEICTDTSIGLPAGSSEQAWPRDAVALTPNQSQRNDGKEPIELFYRLRGYSSPGQQGRGEGVFEVEGIVKRSGASAESDAYLARTLLTRSLYIQSIVAAEDDWAVLAGHHLELGNASITNAQGTKNNSGMVLLDVDETSAYSQSGACSPSSLAKAVGSTSQELGERVWPTHKRGLPLSSLFEKDKAIDQQDGKIRLWSFDDSDPVTPDLDDASQAYHQECESSVVCVRSESSNAFTKTTDVAISSEPGLIKISSANICKNQTGLACHLHVEHMNLSKTKVLIDTSTRPVVVHLRKPKNTELSGMIKLSQEAQLCGSNQSGSECNGKPERLVLISDQGQTGMACNGTQNVLSIEGNALPNALIHFPQGSVSLSGNTKLHGLIWAHSICTNSHNLQLVSEDGNGTVVRAANDLWQWSEQGFPGYGRMVTRGIRGTGLDTFRRW